MMLTATKKRNEPSDHLLFCGQADLDKTTLTTIKLFLKIEFLEK